MDDVVFKKKGGGLVNLQVPTLEKPIPRESET